MAWSFDDRFFWLGLGAFFFVAGRGVAQGLRHILDLTEYDEPDVNTSASREHRAEDSIGLDALRTLAASPNHDIANAAVSLLVSRFALSDTACVELTLSLFSDSAETRERTKQVLDLLDAYPLPTDFPKPDILRVGSVRDLQNAHRADSRTYLMCVRFFKTLGHMHRGLANYRDVAESVESVMTAMQRQQQPSWPSASRPLGSCFADRLPFLSGDDSNNNNNNELYRDLDLSVESLDHLLSQDGSASHPVRVPAAALSALLHNRSGRPVHLPLSRSIRSPEESPEEAEIRRRRHRSARVMEIAEDYIIV